MSNIKKVPLSIITIIALILPFSGNVNAWSGDKDDCGIWLCLPTGFAGSGCSGPLRKHIQRVTHFKPKPPMPSWGACSIGSNEAKQDAKRILRDKGVNLNTERMEKVRNELNAIEDQGQPYTTHYEFTTYSKFFNENEIQMVERGRKSNESSSYCHTGYRYGQKGYSGVGHKGKSGVIIENGVYYQYIRRSHFNDYSYDYKKIGYCTETITTVLDFGNNTNSFNEAIAKGQEMSEDTKRAIEKAMTIDSNFKNMVNNYDAGKSPTGTRYEELDYGIQGAHSGQPAWLTCQGQGYYKKGQSNWKPYNRKDNNYVCKHVKSPRY